MQYHSYNVLIFLGEIGPCEVTASIRNNQLRFLSNKAMSVSLESNSDKLFGKPMIINTRILVDLILEKMAFGDSVQDLLELAQILKETI